MRVVYNCSLHSCLSGTCCSSTAGVWCNTQHEQGRDYTALLDVMSIVGLLVQLWLKVGASRPD